MNTLQKSGNRRIAALLALSLVLASLLATSAVGTEARAGLVGFDQTNEASIFTEAQLESIRNETSVAAAKLLRKELHLEDVDHSIDVLDVVIDGNSARADVRLITNGELGTIDELIYVFALHEDGILKTIFREPSPEFHAHASQVSTRLLPPSRLAFWQELRVQEEDLQRQIGASEYRLPWTGGVRYRVYQDYNKHFDFQLPVGDTVRAARGGSALNGVGSYGEYYVRLTHQDGSYGFYVHLQANTFMVSNGTLVNQGTCIAKSGATGSNITGAHLHFNVNASPSNPGGSPFGSAYTAISFVEGSIPTGGNYTPNSQNSSGSCGGSPPPSNTVIVNPPPISPATGTCAYGWQQIAGYDGKPAYTTQNAQTSNQSTNSATWVPSIGQAGAYSVEVWIPNHGTAFCGSSVSYDTSNAVYTVTDSNGQQFNKKVDQKPLANVWVYLGDVYCATGQSCKVRLTDLTGEAFLSRTVSFSAVKFTLKSTPPPTYSIRGRITASGGAGLAGVSMSAGGKSAQTDANGNYAISGLAAGAYTVTPSKSGYSFSPGSRNVTLGPDASGIDFTASLVTYAIRGRVTDGASGTGVSGVTVSTGGKSAQTDGNGNYAITGLASGAYTVTPSKSGYSFSPGSRNVTLGPDASSIDFTASTVAYAIRGKVATSSGTGVSGVTVSTGGKSAQTDANGNYAITGLASGAYTVTPSKSGYTFSPGSRTVSLGPDASNVNFTATIIQQGEAKIFVHPASSSVSLNAGTHCIKVHAETVQSLTGFEFKLRFPPSLLEGQSVKEGPFLGSTGNSTFPLSKIDNADGTISFGSTIVGSGTGPTGTGEIADICFSPKKEGSANLTFDSGQLLGPNGDDIPATLSGGTIEISSCYWADLNCDGKVTIVDVQKVASHWGTQQGDPLYDPAYDLDNNGTINIADVQKIASQWGWPNREAARPTQPSASIALSLDPESLNLTVGETRQIALMVDGAQNLAAFEAKLNYNPAHLRVNEVVIADFLSSTGRTVIPLGPDIDNSAGTAYFGAASIGDQVGVGGSGVLALVSVTALAPGSGTIDLFDSHATAPDATPFDIDSESDASYSILDEVEEFFLFLPAVVSN